VAEKIKQTPQPELIRGSLMLSDALGAVADWSRVDKDDYLFAMERSPVRDVEIKTILKNAITDRIGDREVFMKGVDNSYRYEGYDAYKTIDIIRS
jgi:cell filamentation protein